MSRSILTPGQLLIVQGLAEKFPEIDSERILFLNRNKPLEPWLSYDALVTIARASGAFKSIEESYSQFIPELKHLIHIATVVDLEGRTYMRSGAARMGEVLENGEEPDEHSLAAARALKAALDAAGFNPLKSASAMPTIDLKLSPAQHSEADQAASRLNDLKAIHKLAADKGLIVPSVDDPEKNDLAAYRDFLQTNFGANTTAGMGAAERAVVINVLRSLPELVAAAA